MTRRLLTPLDLAVLAAAPGSPDPGQVYWDSVLGTQRVWDGTAWRNLPAPAAVITATPATFGATETVVAKMSIAGNTLLAGSTYRITAMGTISGTSPTLLARLRLGTAGTTADTQVCATAATTVTTATGWRVDGLVTVRSVGSGGTALGNCSILPDGLVGHHSAQTATVALNTTVANVVSLTLIGAGTSPVVTVVLAAIEVVRQ